MPLCDPRILDLVLNIFMLHKIVDGCTAHIYIRTHSHWQWHCHTHTQSPKLFISHIFAAWFSGETKSTSKITLECIALPFSDDSFESPARFCLSLYIYFIMSDLFFSAALPPYCISLVFFSLFHSSFTLVSPSYGFSVSVFNLVFILSYLFIYHTF